MESWTSARPFAATVPVKIFCTVTSDPFLSQKKMQGVRSVDPSFSIVALGEALPGMFLARGIGSYEYISQNFACWPTQNRNCP